MLASNAMEMTPPTEHIGEPVTPAMFREVFRRHPGGVIVITAAGDEGPVALTITSLISVSAEPPAVAFSLSSQSSSAAVFKKASHVVVHFIRNSDRALAERCAMKGADRFGPGVSWTTLPTGEPLFTGVSTWFRACISQQVDVHGSTLVVAEPMEGRVLPESRSGWSTEQPLVYVDRQWRVLGAALDKDQPGIPWSLYEPMF